MPINKNTAVLKEYFQKRMKDWLDTVGKKVFGIEHYWLRYEFAPSRGQIHAHMIVVSFHAETVDKAKKIFGCNTDEEMVKFMAEYVKRALNMTASYPEGISREESKDIPEHPASTNLPVDWNESEEDIAQALKRDQANILTKTMTHTCSRFCMREVKK